MRKLILFILLILFSQNNSFSQAKRYLRKAAKATENGHLDQARQYYLKVLEKDKDNYDANVGLGITLSEFFDQPEEALRYLENAYRHSPKDTLPDLLYALSKCYQHESNFKESIKFLDMLKGAVAIDEDDKLFQLDLKKRKEDCIYAMANSANVNPKDWYVVNLGSTVNSKNPEYVPVITPNNELLFTSKRQDDKKEHISDLDGKYFESMYLSQMEGGHFAAPRRYTVPDLFLSSKFRKHHESVISMSPDGKKLYVYRDAKIFEIDMDNVKKENPKKMSKKINFAYYQNHAYISKDGKTLFFTSEAKNGYGGIDIYKSEKVSDGVWGKPENLGPNINTAYDEDAPFLSDDGNTLYFASRGHPGFGNFDIYKSELKDGKWSKPENLGAPINSPAHDIFMVQNKDGNIGYFSSGRKGGKGDMDIYKINYLSNLNNKECTTFNDNAITLSSNVVNEKENEYNFKAAYPEYYKVLQSGWKVNNETVAGKDNILNYKFVKTGDYTIQFKVAAYCDTCIDPIITCNSTTISIKSTEPVVDNNASILAALENYHGKLGNEQLKALGFDLAPLRFNFNRSDIREDAQATLTKNSEILKKHPELRIEINGYADTQGKPGYNINLSSKRSSSVKTYLVKSGLSNKQILKTTGKGATNLLNNCTKGEDCGKEENEINRRAEILVFKK
ncbi:MAG TPA: OmpA family protein [Bacteroidia bacterium]|jgi:outer membrane protein OmpA-like peptidoglycan-associated protein|nr:OmpA family protein [Bacteroidia bacterium]